MAADTRVLVVEDEHDIADFLRAYFRASGYDLVHVDPHDEDDLLAAVRESDADCILLDVRLRGFSGLDAYRQLRADPAFSLVPVILVTADSTAGVRATGVAEGIDGFVAKPFNVQTLESVVADRLAKARQLAAERSDDLGLASAGEVQARLVDRLHAARLGGLEAAFGVVRVTARSDVGARGDEVAARRLVEVARRSLPSGTVLGHTGGGEVAVLLADTGAEEAAALLADLAAEVTGAVRLPGGAAVRVTVAAGVAAYPAHAGTADELYMAADAALAEALDRKAAVVVAR